MRRRFLAAVAALVLIAVGTVVLVGYVRGAEQRAFAGVQAVEVLVAEVAIPAGTPGSALAELVGVELLPAKAAMPGRVTDLATLADRVATIDLEPGEQLLGSRFARPDQRQAPGTVPVPEGMQEVSIVLEPQRAVGGRLSAGDTVGVFVSMGGDAGGTTHSVLHEVLVSQVQGAPAPPAPPADGTASPAAAPAPSGSLMITFAVTAPQAEAIVFAAEHASIWLSLEPADPDVSRTQVLTPDTIYGKAYS
ncbi:RcpC/CpaB family pilus assembly protein [Blastococcus sp. BMG 814]|uniref:RcpC/CpaB family pilus assembly protein n=1 Tax=Blastococcus carthaginiensis TaxID=3050034 RepID=A0ABT9IK27_9ACTN|nr:RcpC/CpaB family pilus assembly protein [Blastococcus carthaginiensis]MDP5185440.1 RcpC/CpaB family pilus assembly protein [Blastococcus carthaginiensis]